MQRYTSLLRALWMMTLSALTLCAGASPLNESFLNAKTVDETYLGALANFEASQEYIPLAVAPLLPNLSISAQNMSNQLNKNEGTGPLPQQNYTSSSRTLTLRQAIIRPSAWVQLKQSSAQVMSAQYELIRAENDLVIRVVSAYMDTLLADEQLKAVEAQIKALQTQLTATQQGYKQGYATRVDMIDMQSRLDQALADHRQVQSARKFSLEQLKLFSGQAQVSSLNIATPDESNSISKNSLQEWIDKAIDRNADILVSKYRVEAVSHEVLKSYTGHLPTLDFVAQVSNSNNENTQFPTTTFSNKQIGLQMNVPLLSGGYVLSTSRQAIQLSKKEERLLNATINNVRLQVNKEFNNYLDGIERIKANTTAHQAAQENLISMRKNSDAGFKTSVDVLNAHHRVMSTQKDLMLSRYQSVLALLRLYLLSGESAEQSLLQVEKLAH